jgi:hypothetical protein
MMAETLTWSHPVVVADLPPEGVELALVPDAAARAELARHVGVLAVPALAAKLKVTPDGRGGAEVAGTLEATVQQTCVVTLDPFDNRLSESIDLRFSPAAGNMDGAIDLNEIDLPDPLIGGTIDLVAVVAEFLALGVDPYPRKPGAVFEPPATGADKGESAFAALKQLKGKSDKA